MWRMGQDKAREAITSNNHFNGFGSSRGLKRAELSLTRLGSYIVVGVVIVVVIVDIRLSSTKNS